MMNLISVINENIVFIIAVAFWLSAGIQLFYYLFFFLRISLHGRKQKNDAAGKTEPVSVVICAKNEADKLKKNIPLIMEQDYNDFELVVVDDCSEDDTPYILEELKREYPALRTTTINIDEKFSHGKKLALTIGIKAARHEWLLLTDADCSPATANWISNMQDNFSDDTSVVLGYGPYHRRKGILNKYIRMDTFFIALQYIGFALAGLPYMGVGRNLAYRKSLFFENKGFASHRHLASGDDDLFISEVANAANTRVALSAGARTLSEPSKSFSGWTTQKRRHFTTAPHYSAGVKWLLAIEPFSRLMFYMFFVLSVFFPFSSIAAGAVFAVRMLLVLIVFNMAMNRLAEKNLLLFSLIYDLFSPFMNIVLYLSNLLKPTPGKWK